MDISQERTIMKVKLKPLRKIHDFRNAHYVNRHIFGTEVVVQDNDVYPVARNKGFLYYTVLPSGEAIILREDWFVTVVDDVQELFDDMIEDL